MGPQGKSIQFGVGGACSTTIFGGEGEIAAPWLPKRQPSGRFPSPACQPKKGFTIIATGTALPQTPASTCASRVGFGVSPKQSLLPLRGAWDVARSCWQPADNIRPACIKLCFPDSLGKLPRLAGWQPIVFG